MTEKETIERVRRKYKDITLLDFLEVKEAFKKEFDTITTREIIKEWRDFIYSLDMAEYKKDRMWEYLNGDMQPEDFTHFVIGVHKGWFK